VLIAARAILLVLHPFRMKALVLGLVVIPLFAVGAGENDMSRAMIRLRSLFSFV